MVKDHSDSRHMGYSFRLAARVLLYAPSHRQDNTYHSICYTSSGALAGTRNSSMGVMHLFSYLMSRCVFESEAVQRRHDLEVASTATNTNRSPQSHVRCITVSESTSRPELPTSILENKKTYAQRKYIIVISKTLFLLYLRLDKPMILAQDVQIHRQTEGMDR